MATIYDIPVSIPSTGAEYIGSGAGAASKFNPYAFARIALDSIGNFNEGRYAGNPLINDAVYGDTSADPIARLAEDIGGMKYRNAYRMINDEIIDYAKSKNNANLYNSFMQNGLMEKIGNTGNGMKDGSDFLLSAGKGAATGAAIGSVIPGIGTAVGAVAGAFAGGLSNMGSQIIGKNNAKRLDSVIDDANRRMLSSAYNQSVANSANNLRNYIKNNTMGTYYRCGGRLYQDGGLMGNPNGFTNGVTSFDVGGTHEQNPNGGIQQGIAPDGFPNLVEQGEVKFDDYIYSARMRITKDMSERYNIPKKMIGKTYAEAARKIQKESEERPFDPISLNGLNHEFNKLTNAQENEKAKQAYIDALSRIQDAGMEAGMQQMPEEEMQDYGQMQPMMRCGGRLKANGGHLYDKGGLTVNPNVDSTRKEMVFFDENIKPSIWEYQSFPIPAHEEQGYNIHSIQYPSYNYISENKKGNNEYTDYTKYLQYAPVIASGIQTMTDSLGLTNRKNYDASNSIRRNAYSLNPVSPALVSGYQPYFLEDENLARANAVRNAQAVNYRMSDFANGNRAMASALLSRQDMQNRLAEQQALEAVRKANYDNRNAVRQYNSSIDAANANTVAAYDKLNQDILNNRLNMLNTAALMDDQMISSRNAALQANRDQFIRNTGEYGKEKMNMNTIYSMALRGMFENVDAKFFIELGYTKQQAANLAKLNNEAYQKRLAEQEKQ